MMYMLLSLSYFANEETKKLSSLAKDTDLISGRASIFI